MAPDSKAGEPTAAASANAASTRKSNFIKKTKKVLTPTDHRPPAAVPPPAQDSNGRLQAPPPATPAQSQREELLAERAENKAAVAAVALLADKTQDQHTTLTAAERILAKRSKALGKKLQRITQYEAQGSQTLNEDQKAVIATKDSVLAAMKELNEVGKAWRQAEEDTIAQQQAETQKVIDHHKKNREANGDATLTLLQQFLRLFTLLHLSQIQAPSFASKLPAGFTDSITSQEAVAVGKLYQEIISLPLYSEVESGKSDQGSIKELLTLIETGDEGKEVLQGVSYARIHALISQLIAPSASTASMENVPEDAKSGAHASAEPINGQTVDSLEALDVAPELVELPSTNRQTASGSFDVGTPDAPRVNGSAHQSAAAVGGITFLQSSEVSRPDSSAPSVAGETDGPVTNKEVAGVAEAGRANEPEGGVTEPAPPSVPGEATGKGAEDGKGLSLGGESEQKSAAALTSASKFDWSADVEGGDNDLGDPLQAFADQQNKPSNGTDGVHAENGRQSFKATGDKEAPAPLQGYKAADDSAGISESGATTSSLKAPSSGQGVKEQITKPSWQQQPFTHHQHQRRGGKPNSNGSTSELVSEHKQQQETPSLPVNKKAPIVDEEGFVLQTSKKSLHHQQQQAQAQAHAQQAGLRGGGRGRGGGGGAGRGAPRGRSGRGEFRGTASKMGRGGAAGSGTAAGTVPSNV